MARCIDADVLIADLAKLADGYLYAESDKDKYAFVYGALTGVRQAIRYAEAEPTADVVEVKHGEWIWDTEDKYKCSECGRITRVDEVMGKPVYECCPYCLTKMDGKPPKGE